MSSCGIILNKFRVSCNLIFFVAIDPAPQSEKIAYYLMLRNLLFDAGHRGLFACPKGTAAVELHSNNADAV